MTGMPPADNPLHEDVHSEPPSKGADRRLPSVLSLAIVSGLNVICLAFMVFHFASHSEQTAVANVNLAANATQKMPEQPVSGHTANSVVGNVDFAVTSKRLISIASHVDTNNDNKPVDRAGSDEITDRVGRGGPSEPIGTWVQIGALSEMATAERYWSSLKKNQTSLLNDQEPRYFGPDDVGGSLYHIRLGPMTNEAADRLCSRLESNGVDCYCIRPLFMN